MNLDFPIIHHYFFILGQSAKMILFGAVLAKKGSSLICHSKHDKAGTSKEKGAWKDFKWTS